MKEEFRDFSIMAVIRQHIRSSYLQRQHEPSTCARAVLTSGLKFLGFDITQEQVASELHTHPYPIGTDHNDLLEYAASQPDLSFHAEHWEGGLAIANIRSPLCSKPNSDSECGHFVLLLGRNTQNGLLQYYCPNLNHICETTEGEFRTFWENSTGELKNWALNLKRKGDTHFPNLYGEFRVGVPLGQSHVFTLYVDDLAEYPCFQGDFWRSGISSSQQFVSPSIVSSTHQLEDLNYKIVRRSPESDAVGIYGLVPLLDKLVVNKGDYVLLRSALGKKAEMTGAEFCRRVIEDRLAEYLEVLEPHVEDILGEDEARLIRYNFCSVKHPVPGQPVSPVVFDFPHAGEEISCIQDGSSKNPLGIEEELASKVFDRDNDLAHMSHDLRTPELCCSFYTSTAFNNSYIIRDCVSRLERETNRRATPNIVTTVLQETQASIPDNQNMSLEEYMKRAAEHYFYTRTVEHALKTARQINGWSVYLGVHSQTPSISEEALVSADAATQRADVDILHYGSPYLAEIVREFFSQTSFKADGEPLVIADNEAYPLFCDGKETNFGKQVILGHYLGQNGLVDDGILIEIRNDHLRDEDTRERILGMYEKLKQLIEKSMPESLIDMAGQTTLKENESLPEFF